MHMSRLIRSTSMAQNRKWLFCNFDVHSNRGQLIGSTYAQGSTHEVDSIGVPAKKSAYRSAPFDMSWLMGLTQFYKHNFFQNIYSKILKLPPIDHKSFILALEAFELRLDEIMILPLINNKSFFKSKSLVTPSNTL